MWRGLVRALAVVALLGAAGCTAVLPESVGGGTATPTATPAGPDDCGVGTHVSFTDPAADPYGWERDLVRVDYRVPRGATVFLVAIGNGSNEGTVASGGTEPGDGEGRVLGHERLAVPGVGMAGERVAVPLTERLTGDHRIRVVMYDDADENERFDPVRDQPCTAAGSTVATEWRTVDFDALPA